LLSSIIQRLSFALLSVGLIIGSLSCKDMKSFTSDDDEESPPYTTPVTFNDPFISFTFKNSDDLKEDGVAYYRLKVQPSNGCVGTTVDQIGEWPHRISVPIKTSCDYQYEIELAPRKSGDKLENVLYGAKGNLSGQQYKALAAFEIKMTIPKIDDEDDSSESDSSD
jgi:hypothetical protein